MLYFVFTAKKCCILFLQQRKKNLTTTTHNTTMNIKLSVAARALGRSFRVTYPRFSTAIKIPTAADDNDQIMDFNQEGDVWDHNFSLGEDGVVNAGLAYRNARVQIITNKIVGKTEKEKLIIGGVDFAGKYNVLEAGEGITLGDFDSELEKRQFALSQGSDLFFEDIGIGAASHIRVGARIISDNPTHALIFRSLMVCN